MFSEKNIVVTIGNYGAVVALHEGSVIKHKIFIDQFNDGIKEELKKLFTSNASTSIYVLLDTIDQSYKKKVYPAIKKADLARIAKRDLASDGEPNAIKNYIVLNQKKIPGKKAGNNRWECLFVSSTNSDDINRWIEFLLEMPNRLVGIYMLPIETFNLFKLLKNSLKSQSKIKNKRNDLYCFIMQNKVSGTRQVVFSDQGIVFTRVVNYDFTKPDFLEKYEQDIYSTFEYLKRLFPDLSMAELDIVNMFSAETLEIIKKINNIELNFINYTPYKAASDIGYPKLLPQNSNFCDLLISKVFSKEKKTLKFITPKITILEKFFAALKISYYANIALMLMICGGILLAALSEKNIREIIDAAETEKFAASQKLAKLNQIALEDAKSAQGDESVNIDKITDFGKTEKLLGSIGANISDLYAQLKFMKDFNVKLNRFSYSLLNFKSTSPAPTTTYQVSFGGTLFNKSGDIEDLFGEFDTLVIQVKKNFEKNQLTYPNLPRDIDFNKKYYSFPIDFNVKQ